MKSKSNYEKRLEYNNTYNRNNYRSFSMRLHNENEADLIEWIESLLGSGENHQKVSVGNSQF